MNPGAYDHAGGVDGAGGLEAGHVAAPDRYGIAVDQHGGDEPRTSGAVDYLAVLNQQVEHGLSLPLLLDSGQYVADLGQDLGDPAGLG